jgi:hypothetical protein
MSGPRRIVEVDDAVSVIDGTGGGAGTGAGAGALDEPPLPHAESRARPTIARQPDMRMEKFSKVHFHALYLNSAIDVQIMFPWRQYAPTSSDNEAFVDEARHPIVESDFDGCRECTA